MQAAVAESRSGRMSGTEFRSFQAGRPDYERWELVGGVAMMMTPPTIAHNQIASNLERLLKVALEQHAPSLLAISDQVLSLAAATTSRSPTSASSTPTTAPVSASSKGPIFWPRWFPTPTKSSCPAQTESEST
jgi:putative restriction endonuclease